MCYPAITCSTQENVLLLILCLPESQRKKISANLLTPIFRFWPAWKSLFLLHADDFFVYILVAVSYMSLFWIVFLFFQGSVFGVFLCQSCRFIKAQFGDKVAQPASAHIHPEWLLGLADCRAQWKEINSTCWFLFLTHSVPWGVTLMDRAPAHRAAACILSDFRGAGLLMHARMCVCAAPAATPRLPSSNAWSPRYWDCRCDKHVFF